MHPLWKHALLCLVFPLGGLAQIVINTLPIPSTDFAEAVSYNQWQATAVTADEEPTTEPIIIAGVIVKLAIKVPNANFYVALVRSLAFRPDLSQVVAEFDTTQLTSNPILDTVIEVELPVIENLTPPTLTTGETYWLALGVKAPDYEQAVSTGLYYWSYANQGSPITAPDGWTVPELVATGGTGGSNWGTDTLTPFSFALIKSAVVIPEPAQMSLGVAGFAFAAGMVLRRPRRQVT